jgi:hypothetical protein
MAKQVNHSATELNDALEHVMYEIWKHKQSVADYRNIVQVCGEAAVEFRVLHNWALLEFFYGPPRHSDRFVASEFISDWHPTHDRAALSWLDPYIDRCNTMLRPISTGRVAKGKTGLKHWNQDWPETEPYIDRAISEFLTGLSDDHKAICLKWIDRWFDPDRPGSAELADLAPALGRTDS